MSAESLSERELEILRLVATGAGNKEIAVTLGISPNTVKVHLRNIFTKIGVTTRTEASLYAVRMGWVSGTFPPPVPAELPQGRSKLRRWLLVGGVLLLLAGLALGGLLAGKGLFPSTSTPTPATPAAPSSRWQLHPPMPSARSGMAVTVYEGSIYLLGGLDQNGPTSAALRFDPASSAWHELPDLPTPLYGAQAAQLGEEVYLTGGCQAGEQPSTKFMSYAPRLQRWQNLSPLPEALCAAALTAFEGRLFLFGGWDGQAYSKKVSVYDPQAGQWSDAAQLPSGRAWAAAIPSNGRIILIGGFNGGRALDETLAYYPARDRPGDQPWQKRAPLPVGRYGMGASALAGSIYLVGGRSDIGSPSPLHYQMESDLWISFDPPPIPAGFLPSLAASETRLYLFGGQDDDTFVDVLQAYQAIYTLLLPGIP
jgi:DNA-binding CsgD family transcriptional regulator